MMFTSVSWVRPMSHRIDSPSQDKQQRKSGMAQNQRIALRRCIARRRQASTPSHNSISVVSPLELMRFNISSRRWPASEFLFSFAHALGNLSWPGQQSSNGGYKQLVHMELWITPKGCAATVVFFLATLAIAAYASSTLHILHRDFFNPL
jgi:hypothetical protein